MENLKEYNDFIGSSIFEGVKIEKTPEGHIKIDGKEYKLEAEYNKKILLSPFGKEWNEVKIQNLSPSSGKLKIEIKNPIPMEDEIDQDLIRKIEDSVKNGEKEIEIPGAMVNKRLVSL